MIVVVGEALVDLVLTRDGALTPALGGAPYNTARTCGRLGAPVGFAGSLSRDRFGAMLGDALVADGVAIDLVERVDEPTTLALAELDGDGHAAYRFYLAATSAPQCRSVRLPSDASALMTGGLALVVEPLAASAESAIRARDPRTVAMVDVNCRPAVVADRDAYVARLQRVLAGTDVVKVSDDDLRYLYPDVATTAAAEQVLASGPSAVLVTRGSAGVTVLAGSGRCEVPIEPVQVVDTIGAGDAFGGGFLAWWTLTGRSRSELAALDVLERAVRAANAVAGVVCTRRGADPPWRRELPDDWDA